MRFFFWGLWCRNHFKHKVNLSAGWNGASLQTSPWHLNRVIVYILYKFVAAGCSRFARLQSYKISVCVIKRKSPLFHVRHRNVSTSKTTKPFYTLSWHQSRTCNTKTKGRTPKNITSLKRDPLKDHGIWPNGRQLSSHWKHNLWAQREFDRDH